ncbi:MAG: hypothetical protein FWD16_01215 [Clostridia bacterium]|nr:hypothetical protein [Clostridia bacterium]
MMYPYMTLSDGTEIVHSQILQNNGQKTVEVHFERPIRDGFDSARCSLPSYEWLIRDGYSDKEIKAFEQMLKSGAHLFFKYAETGGAAIAKAV